MPVKVNETARITSNESLPLGQHCLTFFHHMLGKHIESLNVYLKNASNGQETRVWSKRGNQGDAWTRAQVNLATVEPSIIIFEGVRGTDYLVGLSKLKIVKSQS